jgi:hypothetical protein
MAEGMTFGIFLNIFIGFLFFVFWITVFVILYHLTRFGVGVAPKRLAAAFLFGAVALFCAALILFITMDLTRLNV